MCLLSTDQHTHQLDKWMLRFLIEHALPLDQKAFYANAYSTALASSIFSRKTQHFTEQGRFTDLSLSSSQWRSAGHE